MNNSVKGRAAKVSFHDSMKETTRQKKKVERNVRQSGIYKQEKGILLEQHTDEEYVLNNSNNKPSKYHVVANSSYMVKEMIYLLTTITHSLSGITWIDKSSYYSFQEKVQCFP